MNLTPDFIGRLRWAPEESHRLRGLLGKAAHVQGALLFRQLRGELTLGGQDAVYNPDMNDLEALRVSSGYFGYERQWKPTFTSAFTYGIVDVDNLDIQPTDALKRTQRTTINLTWTPIPQADLVVEFLTGTRVNRDGEKGVSSQIQAGWTFRF